jgi:hypothetical protein
MQTFRRRKIFFCFSRNVVSAVELEPATCQCRQDAAYLIRELVEWPRKPRRQQKICASAIEQAQRAGAKGPGIQTLVGQRRKVRQQGAERSDDAPVPPIAPRAGFFIGDYRQSVAAIKRKMR